MLKLRQMLDWKQLISDLCEQGMTCKLRYNYHDIVGTLLQMHILIAMSNFSHLENLESPHTHTPIDR